jgi:hypothetical protein
MPRLAAAGGGTSPAAGAADGLAADLARAFAETPGRFVCEVPAAAAERFATAMAAVPWAWIGEVRSDDRLEIVSASAGPQADTATVIPLDRLARAWRREGI